MSGWKRGSAPSSIEEKLTTEYTEENEYTENRVHFRLFLRILYVLRSALKRPVAKPGLAHLNFNRIRLTAVITLDLETSPKLVII